MMNMRLKAFKHYSKWMEHGMVSDDLADAAAVWPALGLADGGDLAFQAPGSAEGVFLCTRKMCYRSGRSRSS